MKPIEQIRRERLALLIDEDSRGNQAEFARKIEKDKNQVSQWLGNAGSRNLSATSARAIELKCGKPRGWMDTDPANDAAAPLATSAGFRVEEAQATYQAMDIAALVRTADEIIAKLQEWKAQAQPPPRSTRAIGKSLVEDLSTGGGDVGHEHHRVQKQRNHQRS